MMKTVIMTTTRTERMRMMRSARMPAVQIMTDRKKKKCSCPFAKQDD
jgi:hypothetical protein